MYSNVRTLNKKKCIIVILGVILTLTFVLFGIKSRASGFDEKTLNVNDSIKIDLKRTTWGSKDNMYYLYNVEIRNTGTEKVEDWSMQITNKNSMEVVNDWCCTIKEDGGKTTITPLFYNKVINANGVSSYGFIAKCAEHEFDDLNVVFNGDACNDNGEEVVEPKTTDTPEVLPEVTDEPEILPEVEPKKTEKPEILPEPEETETPYEEDYPNPNDYKSKITVDVLGANITDLSSHTSEFQGLAKNCTKAAYFYADPRESANAKYNKSKEGAKSFAGYILGYDNTDEIEFLNAKIAATYVLNKLYFEPQLKDWYDELINKHGVYIIIEKSQDSLGGAAGIKFGNPNDGFGMQLIPGMFSTFEYGSKVLYHELSHSIWDCGVDQNDFYFGVDPRTNVDYGTGNFIETYTKLYNDSISKNTFYSQMYGWDYVHENYAECAACFFDANWRASLKKNDPIVYNILTQIYNEF